MDLLADRKSTGTIGGTILVNGKLRDRSYKTISTYIPQEECLIVTETVRETVRFYAGIILKRFAIDQHSLDIRLPPTVSNEEKDKRVDEVLKEMGLDHRANAKVGGMLPGGIEIRGLSGGVILSYYIKKIQRKFFWIK